MATNNKATRETTLLVNFRTDNLDKDPSFHVTRFNGYIDGELVCSSEAGSDLAELVRGAISKATGSDVQVLIGMRPGGRGAE
jgi:hypothetical protein